MHLYVASFVSSFCRHCSCVVQCVLHTCRLLRDIILYCGLCIYLLGSSVLHMHAVLHCINTACKVVGSEGLSVNFVCVTLAGVGYRHVSSFQAPRGDEDTP